MRDALTAAARRPALAGLARELRADAGAEAGGVRLGRRLAHGLGLLLPLLLATMSVIGYSYSARQLWLRLLTSLLVVLALQLLRALLLRWVSLVRRRLAMAHAERQHSEAESAAVSAPEGLPASGDGTQSELLVWLEQAQRLVRWITALALVGCLWAIWSGVLPALRALDSVALWRLEPAPAVSAAVGDPASGSGMLQDVAGGAAAVPVAGGTADVAPAARFVSVWDLLVVLPILAVTIAASQNLSGLLEMVVFSHARFERGAGYAITTTARYAIILVGMILAARGLGLAWSNVQWLAAAVTVGIGFGLQEIFADFVSGLILLFERPLRVGDIVTVAGTSGVVIRIQIRATTIRNWENHELILPNKTLVTGGSLNRTLSDSISSIVVTVGIADQADPRLVRDRLLDVARRHPAILKEPAPLVTFEGFGESALNLALRAHVSRPDQRPSTAFELLRVALAYARGCHPVEQPAAALDQRPEFIRVGEELTTRQTLRTEQRLIRLVNQGVGQCRPLNAGFKPDKRFSAEQRTALNTILVRSGDTRQHTGVEAGDALRLLLRGPHVSDPRHGPRGVTGRLLLDAATQPPRRRELTGQQGGSDQFALAADDHPGEPPEPLAGRDFDFGGKPVCQQPKLVGRNAPADNAIEEMVMQARRQALAADARHGYSP